MASGSTDSDIEYEPVRARHARIPWWVLALALTISGFAWFMAERQAEERIQREFDIQVTEIESALRDRMQVYQQILRAADSLFAASDGIDRTQWRIFVDHLELEANYPGVLGLGFTQVLPAAARRAHERQIRAEGVPDYRTWPRRDTAEFSAIVFLEPLTWRNQRAIGFDMMSDPIRRAAMQRARATGEAGLSGKVRLVQETDADPQAGFLMYFPVYRSPRPAPGSGADAAGHEAELYGFVYSPFRMRDLMRATLGQRFPDLALRVYDGNSPHPAGLMFETERWNGTSRDAWRTLALYGHSWTLYVTALPGFGAGLGHRPVLILAVGLLGSLLAFAVSWSLANTHSRAVALAGRMTARLRERKAQLREITASLGEGVLVIDASGRVSFVNPAASGLLGWSFEELLGSEGDVLFHEHRAAGGAVPRCVISEALDRNETYRSENDWFRRKDGTRLPVAVVASPILREGERVGSVIAFRDISERRRVEAALRQSEQFRALFNYSREAWLLLEVDGRIADANPVAGELLGYDRQRLIGASAQRFLRTEAKALSFVEIYQRLRGGGHLVREEIYVRADGSTLPVESVYSLVEHEDRRQFLVAARDMTERRRAEEQLTTAMRELQRARQEAEHANEQLARSNLELLRLAQIDGLTGIANRRYLDDYLANEWRRATRTGHSIALILGDIDHFKAFNDHYGHQEGDECLRRVANTLAAQLSRAGDLLARYGGEEFAVILPETPLEGARQIALSLHEAVGALRIPHLGSPTADHLSLSLGVAALTVHPGMDAAALIEQADRALYRAKSAGRNRVEVYTPDLPPLRVARIPSDAH